MKMKQLTPVIFVDAIEPCLPFWTERLGFSVLAEVKPADSLVFVLLEKDGVQIMYQSKASLADDMPSLEPRDAETSICLYLDVDDLDAVERALEGVPPVIPRRTTFYGATELGVREPAGNLVTFAQHGG